MGSMGIHVLAVEQESKESIIKNIMITIKWKLKSRRRNTMLNIKIKLIISRKRNELCRIPDQNV